MDHHVKFSLFIKCSLKVNTIFFWNCLEVHFILFALFPSNSLYNISLAGESLTHVKFFGSDNTMWWFATPLEMISFLCISYYGWEKRWMRADCNVLTSGNQLFLFPPLWNRSLHNNSLPFTCSLKSWMAFILARMLFTRLLWSCWKLIIETGIFIYLLTPRVSSI